MEQKESVLTLGYSIVHAMWGWIRVAVMKRDIIVGWYLPPCREPVAVCHANQKEEGKKGGKNVLGCRSCMVWIVAHVDKQDAQHGLESVCRY